MQDFVCVVVKNYAIQVENAIIKRFDRLRGDLPSK
jgi:hypothetical protein